MFEGRPVGTPDAGVFWRVISEHQVKCMFTAPTAYRAIRQQDPEAALITKYDLSSFQILFLADERSDPATIQWSEKHLGVPVIDHWWQTETGWAIAANCMGLHPFPVKYGSPTKAVPGWDVRVLDIDNQEMPAAVEGSHVLRHAAKFGGPDDCCGIWAIQAGLFEEGYRIAERLLNRLQQNRFDRLVVGCGHCQKVLTRILPEVFGLKKYPFIENEYTGTGFRIKYRVPRIRLRMSILAPDSELNIVSPEFALYKSAVKGMPRIWRSK